MPDISILPWSTSKEFANFLMGTPGTKNVTYDDVLLLVDLKRIQVVQHRGEILVLNLQNEWESILESDLSSIAKSIKS